MLGALCGLLPEKHARRVRRIWSGLRADRTLPLLWHTFLLKILGRGGAADADSRTRATPVEEGGRTARPLPPSDHRAGEAIPRIIFQTWKTRSLPANFSHWSATFSSFNPQHVHILWDDADNREFILEEFPWFMPYYDGYPREIFRADIVRLFFLFQYGGLYADLDTQCLEPLERTLGRAELVLGRMGLDAQFEHSVPNAMMASTPRQLFWPLAIAMAMERFDACGGPAGLRAAGPERLTGPILIKDAVDYYSVSTEEVVRARAEPVLRHLDAAGIRAGNITLLEPTAWYPLDWNNPLHDWFRREMLARRYIPTPRQARSMFPKSALVTYWTHSW